jgi:hypothetical protein
MQLCDFEIECRSMSFALFGSAPGHAAKSRGRTSQEMRREIRAALAPPEKIGRRSISARAARVNPTTGRAVPADPTRYPEPLRELARINDARVISTSHGKTMAKITIPSRETGRHAAARPASRENPKRAAAPMHARGGSWEASLLAQVEETATAMRKTRSKAKGKEGARVAARQAWAAAEAGVERLERLERRERLESGSGVLGRCPDEAGVEEEDEEDLVDGVEEEEEDGEEEEDAEEEEGEEDGEEDEVDSPARRRPPSDLPSPVSPAIEGTATATLWHEPGPAAVAVRRAREQKPARRVPKRAPGARSAAEGGELERRAEGYWGCGGTAGLKVQAEREAGGAPVPVPRPIRQLQLLTAAHLGELQCAVRRQRAQELFSERRWWYKPVMRRGARYFMLKEGEPVEFILGKRMLCEQNSGPRREGFLVYDCAARALLEAMCASTSNPLRESGRRLGGGGAVAVLRVRATRPCAPKHEQWPTSSGVWAFSVLQPVAVALEKQEWMSYEKCCDRWLPTTQPGLCRVCAMDERTCVQVRNAAPVGEPPARAAARAAAAAAAAARPEELACEKQPKARKALDHTCYV